METNQGDPENLPFLACGHWQWKVRPEHGWELNHFISNVAQWPDLLQNNQGFGLKPPLTSFSNFIPSPEE